MERSRLCVRPGCGEPAVGAFTYNYALRTVWLDDLGPKEPGQHDLCLAHANRMKPPLGWAVEDRRSPIVPFRARAAS